MEKLNLHDHYRPLMEKGKFVMAQIVDYVIYNTSVDVIARSQTYNGWRYYAIHHAKIRRFKDD